MSTRQFSEIAMQRLTSLESGAFVKACYGILLQREPDQAGFETYTHSLRTGTSKREVFNAILGSEEFLQKFAGSEATISAFVELAGTLDFSDRDFLNRVAAAVRLESMNLAPG